MAEIAERFFTARWIDAPVRPGKSPGAVSHPTVPSRILTCCSLSGQAARRDAARPRDRHGVHHGARRAQRSADGADAADAARRERFGEMLSSAPAGRDTDRKQRKAMLAGKVGT